MYTQNQNQKLDVYVDHGKNICLTIVTLNKHTYLFFNRFNFYNHQQLKLNVLGELDGEAKHVDKLFASRA